MKRSEQNAAGKTRYQQMRRIADDVIQKWDPYQLLAAGAPRDEWDSEISSVVAQIPRIHSASDAAAVIARVFGSSVERDTFTPAACSEIGAELYARLREQGFVT